MSSAAGRAIRTSSAADNGGYGQRHFGAAEFGQSDGAAAASLLFHADFGLPNLLHAQVQVAIPLQGIHRQVQMGVDQ